VGETNSNTNTTDNSDTNSVILKNLKSKLVNNTNRVIVDVIFNLII